MNKEFIIDIYLLAATFLIAIAVAFFSGYLTYERSNPPKIVFQPQRVTNHQTKIVKVKGVDYVFSWQRWGSFRVEEMAAVMDVSADHLRSIMGNFCE